MTLERGDHYFNEGEFSYYKNSVQRSDLLTIRCGGNTFANRRSRIEEIGLRITDFMSGFGVSPLFIEIIHDSIFLSTKVYSFDEKIVAEVIRNKWVVNPNEYFKLLKNENALEVIDNYDVPIIQIQFIDINTIYFGGVFRGNFDDGTSQFVLFSQNSSRTFSDSLNKYLEYGRRIPRIFPQIKN